MVDSPEVCCDEWWENLSEDQKKYVHIYFSDIRLRGEDLFTKIEISHNFKFDVENVDRLTGSDRGSSRKHRG